MRVSLLGPVLARCGDTAVDLGGTKQRAVFALLALQAGRVVPMDRLIDDLWRDDPPAQATVTLRAYVTRLRRALEAAAGPDAGGAIRTRPPGWVLMVEPANVDLLDFHDRLALVRARLAGAATDDLPAVCDELIAALGLWRGDALADLRSADVAQEEATRAEDARSAAVELLLETRLQLGQHDRVVEEAGPFLDAHPFRERAWAALILALYRSVRQSDAVAPAGPTLSRTALYRGVLELLAAAHARTPLTVVVDDLQWVDDETLTLLSLAVDELSPRGVVFAVGVRTDEPDAERVLAALAPHAPPPADASPPRRAGAWCRRPPGRRDHRRDPGRRGPVPRRPHDRDGRAARVPRLRAAGPLPRRLGRRDDRRPARPGPLLDALSAYRTSGLAFFEPTFAVLLVEVDDRAGHHVGAHAAVAAAAATTRRTGEVAHGPRLRALAQRLVGTHV